jgi:deazaflavin-dependent oxidoreductase (nitroreductase family)
MPSPAIWKMGNTLHRSIFTATRGRLLGKFFGMPVIALTTIGRKSGQPRTSMLTVPVVDGDMMVIVGSKGGGPTDPLWIGNIKANPDVEILYEGRKRKMRAHIATPEERERLWPRCVESYKGYTSYQKRAGREIPLAVLEPA